MGVCVKREHIYRQTVDIEIVYLFKSCGITEHLLLILINPWYVYSVAMNVITIVTISGCCTMLNLWSNKEFAVWSRE